MRKSKYNTPQKTIDKQQTCRCLQGHIHDSRGEASYCNVLKAKQQAKEIKSYEIQKTFSLDVNGHHIWNHRVDFLVTLPDGSIEVHEYKGARSYSWVAKRRHFQAQYPEIPYKTINHTEKRKGQWTGWTKSGSKSSSGRRKRKVRPKRNF